MQKGQIVLGVATLILALTLYFAGRTISRKGNTVAARVEVLSLEEYDQQQTGKLLPAEKDQLTAIEDSIHLAKADTSLATRKAYFNAMTFWSKKGNEAISAYYLYKYAQVAKTKASYEAAGDQLIVAFKSGSDSTISNNLVTFALRSYEDALQKDGSDVKLKIKLAEVYVQGSQEPMKGIGILRQLADSLPNNVPVLLALGSLSIQSGQYEKAKERFQKVLKLEPQNTEALYFMAITEAQMGNNEEAIRLFEMCKLLVGNKDFNKEIDEIVKNLKRKKV